MLAEFMAALTVSINLLWYTVLKGMGMVGMGEARTMPWWGVWGPLGIMMLVIAYYVFKIFRMPQQLIDENSGSNLY